MTALALAEPVETTGPIDVGPCPRHATCGRYAFACATCETVSACWFHRPESAALWGARHLRDAHTLRAVP